MATKVDPQVVETQASGYETTRDELATVLEKARAEATTLASTSSSRASAMLMQVIDEWVANTKKVILDENMTDIAKVIRSARDDQMDTDLRNANEVSNLAGASTSFLAG